MSKSQVTKKTLTLGQPAKLVATWTQPEPAITRYPGQYFLQSFDPNYLEITGVRWVPGSIERWNPYLELTVLPRRLGKTRVNFDVQYDTFQPLFLEISYEIDIINE